MFKFKKIKTKNDVKDTAINEIQKISDNAMNKMNFGFEVMQQKDEFEKAFINERGKKELVIAKLSAKEKEIKILEEYNSKLYEYLEKITGIVQQVVNESKDMKKEIAELKSDRYLKVPIKEGKTPKGETMKLKNGSKTSKIIKKVKGDK